MSTGTCDEGASEELGVVGVGETGPSRSARSGSRGTRHSGTEQTTSCRACCSLRCCLPCCPRCSLCGVGKDGRQLGRSKALTADRTRRARRSGHWGASQTRSARRGQTGSTKLARLSNGREGANRSMPPKSRIEGINLSEQRRRRLLFRGVKFATVCQTPGWEGRLHRRCWAEFLLSVTLSILKIALDENSPRSRASRTAILRQCP